MRERVTVVTLSVCHFFILEKAPFSGLKLTSVHSRRRFKSFKCSTFLKIEAILEKKRVELRCDLLGQRPVIKRFARDLLACVTLYQNCQLRCSCVGFFPSRRVAGLQTAFLSSK